MGDVYRARDTRLDRIVAIKVLREDAGDKSDTRLSWVSLTPSTRTGARVR